MNKFLSLASTHQLLVFDQLQVQLWEQMVLEKPTFLLLSEVKQVFEFFLLFVWISHDVTDLFVLHVFEHLVQADLRWLLVKLYCE